MDFILKFLIISSFHHDLVDKNIAFLKVFSIFPHFPNCFGKFPPNNLEYSNIFKKKKAQCSTKQQLVWEYLHDKNSIYFSWSNFVDFIRVSTELILFIKHQPTENKQDSRPLFPIKFNIKNQFTYAKSSNSAKNNY